MFLYLLALGISVKKMAKFRNVKDQQWFHYLDQSLLKYSIYVKLVLKFIISRKINCNCQNNKHNNIIR